MKNIIQTLFTLTAVMIITAVCALAQVNPVVYYTFDLANPLAPTIGTTNLSPTGTYDVNTGGQVEKYVTITRAVTQEIRGQAMSASTGATVEFLWKAEHGWDQNRDPFLFYWGNMYARFWWPNLRFETSSTSGSDNFSINLQEAGQRSWSYYKKGWHHFAFVYNATSGIKQVYVDGVLSAGMSKGVAGGTITNGTNQQLVLGLNTTFSSGTMSFDEVTFYNQAITANQVYSNYLNAMAGNHYTFQLATPIAAPPITQPLNVEEFPIGYTLGSTRSNLVPTSALQQLKSFPRPRFRIGTDAPKNFNWVDIGYMGGRLQPTTSDAQAVDSASKINIELATNWNYSFIVNGNFNSTDYSDTTTIEGKMVAVSNRNKQFETGIISLYNQINPRKFFPFWLNESYLQGQICPPNNYIRNSSGQFIDNNGNVSAYKYRSPASPIDSIKIDGSYYRRSFSLLGAVMQDTLDMISENDEVLTRFDSVALRLDPAIIADMATQGFGDARQYAANRYARMFKIVKDSVKSLAAFDSTGWNMYLVDGQDGSLTGVPYNTWNFQQYKVINEDPDLGRVGACSYYPRYPWNWRLWQGAWKGIQQYVEARAVELVDTVKYTAPYVACGWNVNEEENLRPAQWTGLLKVSSILGARRYFTAYFNDANNYQPPNPPPADPKGYAWQMTSPVYAQSATDWVMNNSFDDTLLTGDVPINYQTAPSTPGYRFYSGSEEIQTAINKRDGLDQYGIATAYLNSSNMTDATPLMDTAVFTLDGKTISLESRRQGNVYCLDLDKDTAVIIQYDAWHENTHPQRWSADFYIEAEHYGRYTSRDKDVRTIPYQASASTDLSFFNTTTYLTWRDSASYSRDTLSYQINTISDTTLWLWVRARSINATSAGFSARMDNLGAFTQNNIVDTAFKWYRISGIPDTMKWVSLVKGYHTIKIFPTSARTEIDQLLLTPDRNTILPEGTPGTSDPCTTAFVPTVSPTGPVTQCGGTVTLTGSAAVNYVWSTGATTQSITVASSGSYTVTATNGAGCTGSSAAVVVTINPSISSSITASNTIYCSANVTLTSSNATSYLWSTGATTQAISVANGTYTVTVTNASGCTSQSSQVITLGTVPTATINPSGTTNQCGGTVTLTASPASAYLWSSGQTVQAINATSGVYTVTVTSASGCTAVSSASTVVINPIITALISPASATTCGGNVTLTATAATSYQWSTGATTQIVSVGAGTYTVTVTNASGCTSSTSATVSTATAAIATITPASPIVQCGGTVTLTSSAGSSYLWSDGSTTQAISAVTGNYRVTVTAASGCTAISSLTSVTLSSNPSVSITGSGAICSGTSATLTATAGATYLWNTGATTQSITTSSAGSYTVTVSNSAGCTGSGSGLVTVQTCNCVSTDTLYPTQIGRYRAVVNWGAVPTVSHYILTVTDQGDTTKTQTLTWGSGTTQVLVRWLTPGRLYKVGLKPYCGNTTSDEVFMYFTTLQP